MPNGIHVSTSVLEAGFRNICCKVSNRKVLILSFLHLKRTSWCPMSTSILGNELYHYLLIVPSGKGFIHLGLKSKVLSGILTDICAWMELCTASPKQGVKCQLRYWGWTVYMSTIKFPTAKPLPKFGFKSNVLSGPVTDLSGWWYSALQAHSRV
jgi:hypothetical protein